MITLSAFSDEAGATLDEQIDALKRNDIGLMELRGISGINVLDFDYIAAEKYARQIGTAKIAVSCIASPLGKSDIAEDYGQTIIRLDKLINLCGIFGTDKIRVFSFYNAYKDERALSRLSGWAQRAADSKITLYHENEKDVFGDLPKRVKLILDRVPLIKNIFDPANYVQCGQSVQQTESLIERTDYFHIKDALDDGTIVPAGEGCGEILPLARLVKGRNVIFALEPHLTDFDGLASFEPHTLKHKRIYSGSAEAFDCAADALKRILTAAGYRRTARGQWEEKL